MAGELSYDKGELFKPKDLTIGYLTQHTSLESDKTIWDEMLTVFDQLLVKQQELRQLEEKMTMADTLSEADYEQLLLDYDKKQQECVTNGVNLNTGEKMDVYDGLNFEDVDYRILIK